MASLILLVHLATDSLLEHAGAPGESAIAPDLKGSKRVGAVAVYCTIMCCQILGIFISHHIIQHRNELAAKLQSLKSAALSVAGAALPPPLEDQHSWHFFLSHCQRTAGDQVYSLCLELEAKSFSVWYDQVGVKDLLHIPATSRSSRFLLARSRSDCDRYARRCGWVGNLHPFFKCGCDVSPVRSSGGVTIQSSAPLPQLSN